MTTGKISEHGRSHGSWGGKGGAPVRRQIDSFPVQSTQHRAIPEPRVRPGAIRVGAMGSQGGGVRRDDGRATRPSLPGARQPKHSGFMTDSQRILRRCFPR